MEICIVRYLCHVGCCVIRLNNHMGNSDCFQMYTCLRLISSFSTKGRVSLLIEADAEGEAEEEVAGAEVVAQAEAKMTGKSKGI